LQLNKRDWNNIVPAEDLAAEFTEIKVSRWFEAVASTGQGVFDTLRRSRNRY
jgi:hypothetical protein